MRNNLINNMVNNFEELVDCLQRSYNADPRGDAIIGLAYLFGKCAHMRCKTEEELKPVVEILEGDMRRAFLLGVDNVINYPEENDIESVDDLKPYVAAALLQNRAWSVPARYENLKF